MSFETAPGRNYAKALGFSQKVFRKFLSSSSSSNLGYPDSENDWRAGR
jgi:hypothetical protein